MKLQAVSNRKLYVQIADQIRDQIVSGTANVGQQLPSERDLAISLGVSRPTVREALIALEVAGLVEVRVGVGAFVKSQGGGTIGLPEHNHSPIEIIGARRLIEPEVAALAAQNIGPESKGKLLRIVDTMHAEIATNRWSSESDRALHTVIAEACNNLVLREILTSLWDSRSEELDTRFHQHLADISSVRKHILNDHSQIATAIINADSATARSAMSAHLRYVESAMLAIWD
ncbi:FadR/GntR family transcriptional regulator [Devosia rhodophyticola]|uniref:FadR/GntR family transcriptional regulator n=1 Tax=Devosia rhodophyticola TaxID=3026423 RepID=A0ABY7YU89_9HYPH|nr:FadR/GntR family transcriptional regulator [Devosia rhodophyticola]WDR04762.1 FadR/GntR family transcriptional regulator [Devosia rhodophyticola]